MSSGGFLYNILFFMIAIGILVAFHEFGHYWVARLLKVKVLRFSIGFGKPLFIWKKQRGEDLIEFVIAAIPLGGYVKMLDEREGEVDESLKHRAFNNQTVATRFAIVVAGPLFNFILAAFFYFIFFINGEDGIRPVIAQPAIESIASQAGFQAEDEIIGIAGKEIRTWQEFRISLIDEAIDGGNIAITVRTVDLFEIERKLSIGDRHILKETGDVIPLLGFNLYKPDLPAQLGGITDKSAAATAGLQAQDIIVSINNKVISHWSELVELVQSNAGVELELMVDRNGQQLVITLTPEEKKRGDEIVGFMGAYPQVPEELINKTKVRIEYDVFEALLRSVEETWTFSILTLKVLGKMVIGNASLENISGPITIAQYAGITASIGFLTYMKFLAMISVSLGVLNLLPVPMLDGGHLLYYLIEMVKGSPVSQKIEAMGQQLGLTLLFLLMSLAIFNDIQRLLN